MKHLFSGISPFWSSKVALSIVLLVMAVKSRVHFSTIPRLIDAPPFVAEGLLLLGGMMTLWHYVILRRCAGELGLPDRLVTDRGLYRWIRHPMYLGDLLLGAGAMAMAGEGAVVVLYAIFVVNVYLLAGDEDRMMSRKFAEDFKRWKATTHMIV